MKGDKKYFIKNDKFYKEYTKNEFMFLKCLHGENEEFTIDTLMIDGVQYIEMPAGHVISIDTIAKNKRDQVKHIIIENIPFILKQIALLNRLNIYYSDVLQFCYVNNKMYLIDFDTANIIDDRDKIHYDNFSLLYNFLYVFNIDGNFINTAIRTLKLLSEKGKYFLLAEDKELYNKYFDPTNIPNNVYYSQNNRYCQLNNDNVQILASEVDDNLNGNYIFTQTVLNPKVIDEWEMVAIY